ncbi:cutinase family protein [Mycobacterium sp. SMC-4]|uniref:cutinase family protein n=1 Tax=Mycobacterium sp. SMC-4 TaxID=2857059 RepID=UPI0021B3BA0D|nr:cutinase family protein [Mycobacterium sp. SMC-4]UXA19209.1 cutinase family protein [Mycobacterium sp. SMC-4]
MSVLADHGRACGAVHRIGRTLCAAALLAIVFSAAATLANPGAAAAADDCPDVEVIFARGTLEPPGIGATGQGFVDALRARLPDQSLNVHAVNYPASLDFPRAASGVADVLSRVHATTERCATTDIILGGYSQGAAVTAYATSEAMPSGYVPPIAMPSPLSGRVADRVAAVVMFGRPSSFVTNLAVKDAPPQVIGPSYQGRTLDLCAERDPICAAGGLDRTAHSAYVGNGMASQGADFAAERIGGQ